MVRTRPVWVLFFSSETTFISVLNIWLFVLFVSDLNKAVLASEATSLLILLLVIISVCCIVSYIDPDDEEGHFTMLMSYAFIVYPLCGKYVIVGYIPRFDQNIEVRGWFLFKDKWAISCQPYHTENKLVYDGALFVLDQQMSWTVISIALAHCNNSKHYISWLDPFQSESIFP